jgi:DNA-directed RNA polymerase subunit K/omega
MPTNPSIITRDVDKIAAKVGGNVYEAVAIIAKRARQVSLKNKEELNSKLSDFASSVDNLEEIFENREQIEISKFYERLPKPTSIAIDEFMEDKFYYRKPGEDLPSLDEAESE